MCNFPPQLVRATRPCRVVSQFLFGRDDGVVPGELIIRIILVLQLAKSVQPPRLVTIHGLERLEAGGVVHICRWLFPWLASIEQGHSLIAPCLGKANERVIGCVERGIEISGLSLAMGYTFRVVWRVAGRVLSR